MCASRTVVTIFFIVVMSLTTIQAIVQSDQRTNQKTTTQYSPTNPTTSLRLLRAYNPTEERANIGSSVEQWLKSGTTPVKVLKNLKLKPGVNTIENPMILEWVKYTQMYKSKKGGILSGDKVYSMLAKTISDRNIAPLIDSLRSASEFQGLANGMQTAMFRKWLDSNTNPKAVLDELFFSLLVGNSKIDIWLRYVNEFNAKNKFNRLFSGDDIFNSLRWKASGEGNLAALIVGIKSKFREDMKASLFKMWIDDDVKPESVNSILAGAKLEDKVRNTLENEYMAAYGSEVIRRAGIERKRM